MGQCNTHSSPEGDVVIGQLFEGLLVKCKWSVASKCQRQLCLLGQYCDNIYDVMRSHSATAEIDSEEKLLIIMKSLLDSLVLIFQTVLLRCNISCTLLHAFGSINIYHFPTATENLMWCVYLQITYTLT